MPLIPFIWMPTHRGPYTFIFFSYLYRLLRSVVVSTYTHHTDALFESASYDLISVQIVLRELRMAVRIN